MRRRRVGRSRERASCLGTTSEHWDLEARPATLRHRSGFSKARSPYRRSGICRLHYTTLHSSPCIVCRCGAPTHPPKRNETKPLLSSPLLSSSALHQILPIRSPLSSLNGQSFGLFCPHGAVKGLVLVFRLGSLTRGLYNHQPVVYGVERRRHRWEGSFFKVIYFFPCHFVSLWVGQGVMNIPGLILLH